HICLLGYVGMTCGAHVDGNWRMVNRAGLQALVSSLWPLRPKLPACFFHVALSPQLGWQGDIEPREQVLQCTRGDLLGIWRRPFKGLIPGVLSRCQRSGLGLSVTPNSV